MGKGMEGGGLGLGGVFWVGVCTPDPTPDVCAAEKAAGRSPAEVPHFGLLVSLHGALSASAACVEAKGPVALGCWPGQLAATRTEHSWFVPCPSFLSVRLGTFPANPCHQWDYSWCLTDPRLLPPSHRNPYLPICISSYFIYLPLHLNKRDTRKPRDKVQSSLLLLAGCLCLAPLPPAPQPLGRCFSSQGCSRAGPGRVKGMWWLMAFGASAGGKVLESKTPGWRVAFACLEGRVCKANAGP